MLETLNRFEDPLPAALSSAGVLLLVLDRQGRIVQFNRACEELSGYSFPEVQGQPFWEVLLPPEAAERVRSRFPALRPETVPTRFEGELMTRDRKRRRTSWTNTTLASADGGIEYVIAVGHDITERQRVDDALRRASRAIKALSACNQAVVSATDEQTLLNEICRIVVQVGRYRLAWVGYAEEDEARTVRPVAQAGYEKGYLETVQITWADTERGRGPTGTAIRTGLPVRIRNTQRDPLFVPWRAEAIKRGYASVIGLPLTRGKHVFGALTIYAAEVHAFDAREVRLLTELAADLAYGITTLRTRAERRRAEADLHRLSHRNELILGAAGEGIFGMDLEGRATFVNPAAARMLGWEAEALNGRWIHPVVHPSHPNGTPYAVESCPMEAALADGTARRVTDEVFWRKDGTSFAVEYVTTPIRENGAIIGAVVVFQDVTERKRSEEQLSAAHRRILQDEQERKRFYRQVIRAVTNDKLDLVDAKDIPVEGVPLFRMPFAQMRDYPLFRRRLWEALEEDGFDRQRAQELVLAVSEAVINSIKHAHSGTGAVYAAPDRILVRVTDRGQGIKPEDLPATILKPGFSTKVSLGMGYTLMLQHADRVWLSTGPEGTVVQIEKQREADRRQETPLAAALQRL